MMEQLKKIVLHKAQKVTDYDGTILENAVLGALEAGTVVRVSMVFAPDYDRYDIVPFTHDAPYARILEIRDDSILGEVLEEGRICDEDKYPVRSGERMWFSRENIIEIPAKLQPAPGGIEKFRTAGRVTITGPLYTIVEEPCRSESDSESESSDSESDQDSESEQVP